MLLLLATAALAYETDELTGRADPLDDALEPANAQINLMIAEAVERSNKETRCAANDAVTRESLARNIFRLTSRDTKIKGRKGLKGFGYGAYSAWLETADVDKRTFEDRADIYGAVDPGESLILATAGICSTVQLGGVLLGTDKVDHFLGEGYAYAVVSRMGKRPKRAIRWGTNSELTFFGFLTSAAFSFADLRANWGGYQFYTTLLEPESAFARDAEGCVVQTRSFDWSEWLDTDFDEVLNPSVYTKDVGAEVSNRLVTHRDQYCNGYEVWGKGLTERVLDAIARTPPYASHAAPVRTDPFQLDALCAVRPAASGPVSARPEASSATDASNAP